VYCGGSDVGVFYTTSIELAEEGAGTIIKWEIEPRYLGDAVLITEPSAMDYINRKFIDFFAQRGLLINTTNTDNKFGQCMLDRSNVSYDGTYLVFVVHLVHTNSVHQLNLARDFLGLVKAVDEENGRGVSSNSIDWLAAANHGRDLAFLREFIRQEGALAFIANGSILPRVSGDSDLPARPSRYGLQGNNGDGDGDGDGDGGKHVVCFKSPPSLEQTVTLPLSRLTLTGLFVRAGVTVISGGGFQGKSTLLKVLAGGHLNRVVGDGREYCVSTDCLSTLRAEDGRRVCSVDISAFIADLPAAAGLDAYNFTTTNASGSTSQAAAVVEGLEAGAKGFLIDEDTSAVNFMIRDSRMRSLIDRETITPYIYRCSHLFQDKGISTVVVVGGSGDWFDVQTQTLLLDNYVCTDATARARRISKAFCSGHIQYNGQGLVHQLPWPGPATISPLPAVAAREQLLGVKERFVSMQSLRRLYPKRTVWSVSPDGKSVRYPCPNPNSNLKPVSSSSSSNSCSDDLVLDLSRVDGAAASGEPYATAMGIAMAIFFMCRLLPLSGLDHKAGVIIPPTTPIPGITITPSSDHSSGGLLGEGEEEGEDGSGSGSCSDWVRVGHLLDLYTSTIRGHTEWVIATAMQAQTQAQQKEKKGGEDEDEDEEGVVLDTVAWQRLGAGFVWPDRLLLAKALNRLPGAEFKITKCD
jgi:hypothetical protein